MFHLWTNQVVTLPRVFFKYFASKDQLPSFYISGTLVENGLKKSVNDLASIYSDQFFVITTLFCQRKTK